MSKEQFTVDHITTNLDGSFNIHTKEGKVFRNCWVKDHQGPESDVVVKMEAVAAPEVTIDHAALDLQAHMDARDPHAADDGEPR